MYKMLCRSRMLCYAKESLLVNERQRRVVGRRGICESSLMMYEMPMMVGREKTADEWFSLTPINKIIRPSLVPIYSPGVSLYSHHVNHLFMLSPPACLPLITKRRSLIINWKGIGAITGEEEEEEHHQQRAQEHVPRNLIIVIASKARDSFFRV